MSPQTFVAPTVSVRFGAGPDFSSFVLGSGAILGSSVLGTALPYTDLSSKVRKLVLRQGRSRELAHYTAATTTATFDNQDNSLSPFNLSGPYSSGGKTQVLPGRMMKTILTWDGTDYPLSKTMIRDWNLNYKFGGISGTTGQGDGVSVAVGSGLLADLQNQTVSLSTSAGKAGQAINSILDVCDPAITSRNVDTGLHDMAGISVSGNALEAIRLFSFSEKIDVSDVWTDNENVLQWGGATSLDSTVSLTTIGVAGMPIHKIHVDMDSTLIRNKMTLTRQGSSSPQVAEDATSISEFGRKSLDKTGITLASDSDTLQLGTAGVALLKDPKARVRQVELAPLSAATDALMIQCLTRQLRDLISVSWTPVGATAPIVEKHHIIGIEHIFTPQNMRTIWTLNDAEDRIGQYFILGTATLPTKLSW